MRYFKFSLVLLFIQSLLLSCSKEKATPVTSSLTVINAVVGSNPIVTNFSSSYGLDNYYRNARKINYGSFSADYQFGSYSGTVNLILYQYPDTMEHHAPLYNLSLDISENAIHTLFLTGLVASPDTVFTTDYPPYHPSTDSSMGLRFINLSPGSNPVNVTLSTNSMVNELSNISYKTITGFKNFPVTSSVSSYTFQFRDVGTNTVLSSYTMNGINNGTGANTSVNNYRFRNFTIALIGLPNGSGATSQKAFLINNY